MREGSSWALVLPWFLHLGLFICLAPTSTTTLADIRKLERIVISNTAISAAHFNHRRGHKNGCTCDKVARCMGLRSPDMRFLVIIASRRIFRSKKSYPSDVQLFLAFHSGETDEACRMAAIAKAAMDCNCTSGWSRGLHDRIATCTSYSRAA